MDAQPSRDEDSSLDEKPSISKTGITDSAYHAVTVSAGRPELCQDATPSANAQLTQESFEKHEASDMTPKQSSGAFEVRDLLEELLSNAVCRSLDGKKDGIDGCTVTPQENPPAAPNNAGRQVGMKKTPLLLSDKNSTPGSTASQSDSESDSDSDSGSDSSNTESKDDGPAPIKNTSEPDVDPDVNVALFTKNEKDANSIHIPCPDFFVTEEHTLIKVGTISSVLENVVIVTTFNLLEPPRQRPASDTENATALDSGTILCLPDRTVLGAIYETFGPVASPLYLVRYNGPEEIPSSAKTGADVLYVEQKMCLVHGRDIRGKGYDASGKDDEEAQAEEYSDDELERLAKKKKRSGGCDQQSSPKRSRGRDHFRGGARTYQGQRTSAPSGPSRAGERPQYENRGSRRAADAQHDRHPRERLHTNNLALPSASHNIPAAFHNPYVYPAGHDARLRNQTNAMENAMQGANPYGSYPLPPQRMNVGPFAPPHMHPYPGLIGGGHSIGAPNPVYSGHVHPSSFPGRGNPMPHYPPQQEWDPRARGGYPYLNPQTASGFPQYAPQYRSMNHNGPGGPQPTPVAGYHQSWATGWGTHQPAHGNLTEPERAPRETTWEQGQRWSQSGNDDQHGYGP